MRPVVRPTWRANGEQKRLLAAINRAIDHQAEVHEKEEQKIWALVARARQAGVPDTQIVKNTGLGKTTLNRRLGPRSPSEPESDTAPSD